MFIVSLAIAAALAELNLLDSAANLDRHRDGDNCLIRISLNQSSRDSHSALLYLALGIGARICQSGCL